MSNVFNDLAYYLSYPFVRYALIVGTLVALCSSLLGVTLVLKRYSFIGDGLSHVAFGAMAVAAVLNLQDHNTLVVMPITIISAIILLKSGQNSKIKGDAAIAMLSVSALAIGYMLMNVFSKSANVSGDVCSTLFGSTSILTLTFKDVVVCVVLSIIVLVAFVLMYNRIFAITFDEDFATATGIRTKLCNMILAIMIAVVIVLGMNLVGSLLISALIIFPALSAMRVCNTYRGVIIVSAIISVVCALIGMVMTILFSTPVGATIVVVDLVFFGIFVIIGKFCAA